MRALHMRSIASIGSNSIEHVTLKFFLSQITGFPDVPFGSWVNPLPNFLNENLAEHVAWSQKFQILQESTTAKDNTCFTLCEWVLEIR